MGPSAVYDNNMAFVHTTGLNIIVWTVTACSVCLSYPCLECTAIRQVTLLQRRVAWLWGVMEFPSSRQITRTVSLARWQGRTSFDLKWIETTSVSCECPQEAIPNKRLVLLIVWQCTMVTAWLRNASRRPPDTILEVGLVTSQDEWTAGVVVP